MIVKGVEVSPGAEAALTLWMQGHVNKKDLSERETVMGAKTAAAALMAHDADLANGVRSLPDDPNEVIPAAAKLIRETAGTWTLALAAAAADVSERQVLVALVQKYIHPSTTPAASGFVDAALANHI